MGPGRLLREEERQAGSQPAPLHRGPLTLTGASRSQGHTHRGGREERCGEEALQEGGWSLAPWGAGGREKGGERARERGEAWGEGRADAGGVGGRECAGFWLERAEMQIRPCCQRPLASVSPPVRHCCCGCSAIPWCVEAPVLEPHVLPFPPASTERSWADLAPPPTGPGAPQPPLLSPFTANAGVQPSHRSVSGPRALLRGRVLSGPRYWACVKGQWAASPCAQAPFRGGAAGSPYAPPHPPRCRLWKHRMGALPWEAGGRSLSCRNPRPRNPRSQGQVDLDLSSQQRTDGEKLSGRHTPPRASLVWTASVCRAPWRGLTGTL